MRHDSLPERKTNNVRTSYANMHNKRFPSVDEQQIFPLGWSTYRQSKMLFLSLDLGLMAVRNQYSSVRLLAVCNLKVIMALCLHHLSLISCLNLQKFFSELSIQHM